MIYKNVVEKLSIRGKPVFCKTCRFFGREKPKAFLKTQVLIVKKLQNKTIYISAAGTQSYVKHQRSVKVISVVCEMQCSRRVEEVEAANSESLFSSSRN